MFGPNDNFRRLLLAFQALTQNKGAMAALRALVTVDTLLMPFLFGQDYFGWWRSLLPPAVDGALVVLMVSLSLTLCAFLTLIACLYFTFQGRSFTDRPVSRLFRVALLPALYGLPALWGRAYLTGNSADLWGSLAVAFAVCYQLGVVSLVTLERLQTRKRDGTAAPSVGLGPNAEEAAKRPALNRKNIVSRIRGVFRRQWWLLTHRDYVRRMSPLNRSLYVAVWRRDTHAMSKCLAQGADPNLRVVFDLPLLIFANKQGWTEVVRLLLEAGADPKAVSPNTCITPLLVAASRGDIAAVRLLLKHGAAVDAHNRNGVTALSLASRQNHVEVMRLLLTHGAEVNGRSLKGSTALMVAASGGHVKSVGALLEAGADISLADAKGVTALEYARRKGHVASVAALEAGAQTEKDRDACKRGQC